MTTLGSAGGVPFDINEFGHVVGYISDSGGFRPVVWQHGAVLELPTPPGCPYTIAVANNNVGQILGNCINPESTRTLLWQCDHQINCGHYSMRDLGTALDGADINDRGWIVGQDTTTRHSVLRRPSGTVQDLGTLPGFTASSHARGVNNAGQITGESNSDFDSTAFIWERGLPSPTVIFQASGKSINQRGHIAGTVRDANFTLRALLWR